MSFLAITGATGAVGGLVARAVAEHDVDARLIVRDATRAPELGLPVWEAEYADGAGLREALAGVDVALLISAHENEQRVEEHRSFIEAAKDAGVEHLVYTSFIDAAADSTFLLGRDHGATEDLIRESGMHHTFLRDNFYAEILADFADDEGVLRGPARDGRVAAVSQRDVASVAAAVLLDPASHVDRTYDLTGPEALTLTEVAAVLTDVTGRPHRFVDETLEEAHASRVDLGAPDWLVDAWISTYTAMADGDLAAVSGDVETVLGRPALSVEAALRARPA